MAKHWTAQTPEEKFEVLVGELEDLLHSNGFAHLFGAFSLMVRRQAARWLEGNQLEQHDTWMGLYARLRSLYESKAIPASWPRPKFRWF